MPGHWGGSSKSTGKSHGMSPGRSQAQFGHAGHAGKTQTQAHRDQRSGRDTPASKQHITGGGGGAPKTKTVTTGGQSPFAYTRPQPNWLTRYNVNRPKGPTTWNKWRQHVLMSDLLKKGLKKGQGPLKKASKSIGTSVL